MQVGALTAVVALLAAGCAGSGGDKAGGVDEQPAGAAPVGKPVTLTLLTVDELWASEFAAAARRLSGGTIRIEVRIGGSAIVDYERRLVEQVRAGRGDLVSVGARAWDRMGVTSLRALVAPFLVRSLEHQRRVLASPLAVRALDGLARLDLVGLALLPGPLRHPFGITRPLLGPRDYAGVTFGHRYGRVARDTLTALGATPKGYAIGSLGGLDGAELDPWTIARNGYDRPGTTLTANVPLWARPETIVIRRAAFERLAPAQREVLRRAGRAAVAPVLARWRRELDASFDAVCARGRMELATATAAEVGALRAAAGPVLAALERDPQTRRLLAEIRRLAGSPAATPACARRRAATRALEGRWSSSASPAELVAAGASDAEVATFAGTGTLELAGGRWTFRNERTTVLGTYVVAGDTVRLTMRTCTANPCSPGAATEYGWSVFHESTLTLTGRGEAWARLVATPARRSAEGAP